MDKLIAITGGIGSGKSTVSTIIKQLNYKVFSADEVYRDLLSDSGFVKTIYTALGIESEDFVFDKELISKKVFNNKEMLSKLNAVTHPAIMDRMLNLSKAEKGIVFNEVPLLFEGGYESLYDKVIIVIRDEKSRVDAVAKRDNISASDVKKRIDNQVNYENISTNAHTLIVNDGSLSELTKKVKAVISEIVKG